MLGTLDPVSNLRELEKLNLYNSDGLEGAMVIVVVVLSHKDYFRRRQP